ncbi:MAG: beta galactosidase jelly roll domain-containing protein, partial [Oscillospiraceae bacterium]|nr:beta galactosidase jelly roll domain-containing protein [Oscillospiraceae bacterium]
MTVQLLQDWKFICEDAGEAFNRAYDDSAWKDVVVPHDWSVSFPFSRDNSSGTGYLPGGIGWYRTRFTVPAEAKTAFLVFDGVYKNAQVWVNGYYLGKRPSGYADFRHDISPFMRAGEENILSVKVTHTDIADSRWFTGSGIYRKVKLIAHSGAYIPDQSVVFTYDGEYAHILAEVVGAPEKPVEVTLGGAPGGASDTKHIISAADILAGGGKIDLRIKIDSPRLWSCETPNLYTLAFKEGGEGGADMCEPVRVGLRTFNFDADKGFSLNGATMKMKGVCVHHDAGCLGAAVWRDVWHRRLTRLKGCGCNAIRMSHNPHMPELYDLCDEMGFIVMDEAFDEWEGCKNKWVRGHNVYPPAHQGYYEDFPEWHERDLAAMVIRGRNHPSILMWSVGNEIDYPNDPYAHPLFKNIS